MSMDKINPFGQQPGSSNRSMIVGQNDGGSVDFYRDRPSASYSTVEDNPETSGFSFYKYLRILSKYRWFIVSTIASCIVLATVITLLMTPIYRATSSIQIDREAMNVLKVDGVQPDDSQVGGMEFYQTQYELLASRSLAARVITTLNLADDPRFATEKPSLVQNIRRYISGATRPGVAAPISDGEERQRKAVSRLLESLVVAPVRGSKIVKISIDHQDAELAQKISNGYAQVFIEDNLDRRYDATSYARKFLEDRLAQLKLKLEESEKQAVQYAQDNGIISLDGKKDLSSTDLESINSKLAEAHGARLKKELLWKQAQLAGSLGLKEILDSPTIQDNLKNRAQLSAEYQRKLSIFKPSYPEMVQLSSQIKELDRQVQTEVSSIKQSIQAQYLAAKSEEDSLQQQLDSSKANVIDQRNRGIKYNILQREVDTNRTLYEGLLQRYKEIGVAGGIGTNNISIVDKATRPLLPRSPRLTLNLILAAIFGLTLGVLVAIGLDYLDDSFKAPEDVERELGLPVIGVVPKPQAGASVEDELDNPRSSLSEAYRSLRTGLQFATSEGLPRTLLFTSSVPSEGKTTSTINVARSLSHIGLNVLLIDCDLRNASIHRRIGIPNEVGLSNYLSGAKHPEEVVQRTDSEHLVIMTAGPLPPNPAELLSGPKLPALLNLASESFDVVLIDGPPVMGLADAPLISSVTQGTVLVIAANETRRNTVRVAQRRLRNARSNIIGTLLNKFDVKLTGYGYGYGYGQSDYSYHSYGVKELPDVGS